MENLGAIKKIDPSDWATLIVPVLKPSGEVRLCGDYKVTPNPALEELSYPMPKAEELFDRVNGGKIFTKLDLSNAYMQLPLTEEGSKLTALNTHKGLYAVLRMPFGITSASGIFQKRMYQLLQGCEMTACNIDDILVAGKDEADHLRNLERVLKVLTEHGFRLKKAKCQVVAFGRIPRSSNRRFRYQTARSKAKRYQKCSKTNKRPRD